MPSEPTHPPGCECGRYACSLRTKGVQVSPAGMVSHNRIPPKSNAQYNGWERGTMSEERPGGKRMPVLDGNGDAIPLKKASEKGLHDKLVEQRRKNSTSPATA